MNGNRRPEEKHVEVAEGGGKERKQKTGILYQKLNEKKLNDRHNDGGVGNVDGDSVLKKNNIDKQETQGETKGGVGK